MSSINNTSHSGAPVNKRYSFGKIKHESEYPDFLEIQVKSFQEFFQLETTPENRINEDLKHKKIYFNFLCFVLINRKNLTFVRLEIIAEEA
jgi:DNA-directed RNA polymerase beta subunit